MINFLAFVSIQHDIGKYVSTTYQPLNFERRNVYIPKKLLQNQAKKNFFTLIKGFDHLLARKCKTYK